MGRLRYAWIVVRCTVFGHQWLPTTAWAHQQSCGRCWLHRTKSKGYA